jgi:DNA-binding CsgD family transcriptional regulator
MGDELSVYDEIVRGAVERHSGYVFDTGGDGMRSVFSTPADAAGAAIESQQQLCDDDTVDFMVAMALHTAEASDSDGIYSGNEVNRGATQAAELELAGAALDLGAAAAYSLRQIDVARRDPGRGTRAERPSGLSRREVEVLRLVADGRTSGEIAKHLFISPRTAEHHVQNIYTKIGVSSRAAATRWAVQHQVVDGPG